MQTHPVAIGGIGGSGTRVIAGILLDLGYHLGDDLNESLDNLLFTLLFKRRSLWPPEHHQAEIEQLASLFINLMQGESALDESEQPLLQKCVYETTEEHPLAWRQQRLSLLNQNRAAAAKTGPWGWKEPNTHIVLPMLQQAVPGLKYIHVMRHGVDMAFSSNQNQLKLWGAGLLGHEIDWQSPSDSLSYWCAVHKRLLESGNGTDDRLLLLNFDEFCHSPQTGLRTLIGFLGDEIEPSVIDGLASSVNVPDSIGRYRQSDLSRFAEQDLAFVRSLGFVV